MVESILRQKLKPAQPSLEEDAASNGLAGVLGKAASVVGLTVLDVQLEANSRAAISCAPSDFMEALPENGLTFRIECATEEQIGLLALDPTLTNSINNVLTGALVKGEATQPRQATDIDAALCQPFLNGVFEAFRDMLQELRGGKVTDCYQTTQIEKDPSPHAFPEVDYLQIKLDFDISDGAGLGQLSLMMPAINTEFTTAQPSTRESSSEWREIITSAVKAAPASFDVVLYRKKKPIGQILKLKKGDVIEVPARALENLSIESRMGAGSQSLMHARLGEYQEMRAAKITRIGETPLAESSPKLLETALEPAEIPDNA